MITFRFFARGGLVLRDGQVIASATTDRGLLALLRLYGDASRYPDVPEVDE